MPDLPHLPWPYQLGEVVEQDTPAEHQASAAVIACTPRGDRDDDPAVGVTEPIWKSRPVDTERFAREIARSDPRLQPTAREISSIADAVAAIAVDPNARGS